MDAVSKTQHPTHHAPLPLRRALVTFLALFPATILISQDPEKDDKDTEVYVLSPFEVSGSLGLTPGGAKDVDYARDRLMNGEPVDAGMFTAEGLFSGYDLPLGEKEESRDLVRVRAESTPAKILAVPDATHLAQIGFDTALKIEDFKRQPLNLVAVVDKSGSMNGQPLSLVKDCLLEILGHLGPSDRLSIVLYGDTAYVYMEPTQVTDGNRERMRVSIHNIESNGSTYMEEGLKVGYKLARKSKEHFSGSTRLMLFTDEQPNVGNTSQEGFMGQIRGGSADGIGTTIIGVGEEFNAKLANTVSAARGCNLYFFANSTAMVARFREDFDFMVTEMAHDLILRVVPVPGAEIKGVYGLPGSLLHWDKSGAMELQVETLFLSRERGAIFLAFKARNETARGKLADISLSYRPAGGDAPKKMSIDIPVMAPAKTGLGLQRGMLLVNEYASIQKAISLLTNKDLTGAAAEMRSLSTLFRDEKDPSLDKERNLVARMTSAVCYEAGQRDEFPIDATPLQKQMAGVWTVTLDAAGMPEVIAHDLAGLPAEERTFLMRIWPVGYVDVYDAKGINLLSTFALVLKDGLLLLDFDGLEMEMSVEPDGRNIVLRQNGTDAKAVLVPSAIEPQVRTSSERDPVSGLPK